MFLLTGSQFGNEVHKTFPSKHSQNVHSSLACSISSCVQLDTDFWAGDAVGLGLINFSKILQKKEKCKPLVEIPKSYKACNS